MVATLDPVARRDAVRPEEVPTGKAAGSAPSYLKAEKVRETIPGVAMHPAHAMPGKATAPQVRRGFLARVTGSLEAVDRALSGPPMTERERERRAINEASCRHSTSLMWSQRIYW